VKEIYAYYKKFGHATQVMGASFRNKGEILELAGCDLLTISPQLLGELKNSTEAVERKLSPAIANESKIERLDSMKRNSLAAQRKRHGDGKNRGRRPRLHADAVNSSSLLPRSFERARSSTPTGLNRRFAAEDSTPSELREWVTSTGVATPTSWQRRAE